MLMLMQVTIPHEPFNDFVRDGTIGEKIKRILDAAKPQAVFFTEQYGERGAILAIDVADASKVPFYAEPWFLTFNAEVHFQIAMTPDILSAAGLEALGKQWA